MKKIIIILLVIFVTISLFFYFLEKKEKEIQQRKEQQIIELTKCNIDAYNVYLENVSKIGETRAKEEYTEGLTTCRLRYGDTSGYFPL